MVLLGRRPTSDVGNFQTLMHALERADLHANKGRSLRCTNHSRHEPIPLTDFYRLTSLMDFANVRMGNAGICMLRKPDSSRKKCIYNGRVAHLPFSASNASPLGHSWNSSLLKLHPYYGFDHYPLALSACCVPRICTINMHDSTASFRAAIGFHEHGLPLDHYLD